MNRFLIPLALAALVAGCAMPGIFGHQSNEPDLADSAQTVVVREIYHETPVVYVDTVYLAEEPAPVQPVCVEEEYNEYNEYNQTNVYVHEQVVLPPPPHPHRPRWSPRQHEPRPSRPPRDEEKLRPPGGQPEPDQPEGPVPKPPTKRKPAPVTVDRQKSPNRPTPPKRQAPAQVGSAPAAPVQHESPKQAPTPPVDKSAGPESDAVQVQVGMNQAGTGLHAARVKK